jgi:hypothetical protein
MRLADTPGLTRAGGIAAPVTAGPVTAEGEPTVDTGLVFAAAVAALEAGRDAVAEVRDDLDFEEWPAPKRLAPHAAALAATAYRDGVEVGTAQLMVLYDPAGQEGWTGTFRLVIQVHADVEEEMAADPLLGEVGWSWLTDALDQHAPGYRAPSGTVTRVITEGYGSKEEDPLSTAFELRASWCPADDEISDEISGAVLAWSDLLAAAAGLPSQPAGTVALARRGQPARGTGHRGGRRR